MRRRTKVTNNETMWGSKEHYVADADAIVHEKTCGSVAPTVEHAPRKAVVAGSSPARASIPVRLIPIEIKADGDPDHVLEIDPADLAALISAAAASRLKKVRI